MARHISFALTTKQFLDGTKDVTRRIGWSALKAGEILVAVEKSQGLKRGEKVKRLGTIRVVSVRREPVSAIDQADVVREGFPDMTPDEFVEFFCKSHRPCQASWPITRIEFVRIA